jgi:hypothetical protein
MTTTAVAFYCIRINGKYNLSLNIHGTLTITMSRVTVIPQF